MNPPFIQVTRLILGSTSPYRRELLARLRWPFEVQAPQVDETPQPDEAPAALAVRLARAKACDVAQRERGSVVIGSDQVADLQGRVIGKPHTHVNAVAQLHAMSGQSVVFQTAVCVARYNEETLDFCEQALVEVKVRFRPLSMVEIERYLSLENSLDCAGSAKSEGLGIVLLESMESLDPTALVGLPLIQTARLLRQAGIDPLNMRPE